MIVMVPTTTAPLCAARPRPAARTRLPQPAQCSLAFSRWKRAESNDSSKGNKPHGASTSSLSSTSSVSDADEAGPSNPTGMEKLTKLANMLLMNAASLREPRGVAHCLRCKGMGTVDCKMCKGSGVLSREKVLAQAQQRSVRRLVSNLEQMVGMSSVVAHDQDWAVSNRCPKCRGKGRCMCPACQGSGHSGPQSSGGAQARAK